MKRNGLVTIPSARVIDEMTEWVYDAIKWWLPHPEDPREGVAPHVITQRGRTYPIDLETLQAYDPDETLDRDEYYDIDVDPDWQGQCVKSDELRARSADGRVVHATVEAWVINEPRAASWLGDAETKRDGSSVIRVMFNWASIDTDDNPRRLRGEGYGAKIYNTIRAILVHEIVHWLDPNSRGEQDDLGHADPRDMVLPWEMKAWEKAYASDPREFEPLKREAYERLKQLWLDEGPRDYAGFPMHLWRQVLEEAPNIATMLKYADAKTKRAVLRDITTAWDKHIGRWRRRVQLGYE